MFHNLCGQYRCSIESGRLKLPAPLCRALKIESKQQFHMTREKSDRLHLYSQQLWEERVDELMRLRKQHGGEEKFREIVDSYCPIDVDKNGRMTIPQDIRERAGLDKKVVVVGMLDHMEIWDFEKYERSFRRM
ncbi:MAG: hypothetical protein JSV84_11625 [Gemmatimonadota bacterium]|nr:MAG: hypothetical protein JSV84_11625 [Gemmatimonadota bacterium]